MPKAMGISHRHGWLGLLSMSWDALGETASIVTPELIGGVAAIEQHIMTKLNVTYPAGKGGTTYRFVDLCHRRLARPAVPVAECAPVSSIASVMADGGSLDNALDRMKAGILPCHQSTWRD